MYVKGWTKSATGVNQENHLACCVQIQAPPSPKRAPRAAAWKLRRWASAATILPKALQSCMVATQVRLFFFVRFGGQAGAASATSSASSASSAGAADGGVR